MMSMRRRLSKFAFRWLPMPGCLLHARREYGYSWRELVSAWRRAKARPDESVLGLFPRSKAVEFYSALARRSHDEAVTYRCIEGCCSVWWHPFRGNLGGAGPAGCPCDERDDPRDLSLGPISGTHE